MCSAARRRVMKYMIAIVWIFNKPRVNGDGIII